jgi:hypothetical protein
MKNFKITLFIVFAILTNTNCFGNLNLKNNKTNISNGKTSVRQYSSYLRKIEKSKELFNLMFLDKNDVKLVLKNNLEESNLTLIYTWEIETEEGLSIGSSFTIEHAKKCIEILSKNTKVYSKMIVSSEN